MKIRKLSLVVCLVVLPLAIVCNFPPTAVGGGADEKAVRDADEAWAKAAATKDVDKTVAFYADDALVLPPNEPMVTTKDGIRNLWKGFLDSITDISWKATRVEMAKSGDMAALTGTYEMTMKDGTKERGKYCEVWEKKAGGKWKCGSDMFSSDLPAQPAASPAPGAAEKK
jgi:ketosteroid isomerase-like protein